MTTRSAPWLRSTLIASVLAATTAVAPMTAYAARSELERSSQTSGPDQAPGSRAPDAKEVAELTARQQSAAPQANFAGGDPVLIIGGSTLLLILLVVFLVLILT